MSVNSQPSTADSNSVERVVIEFDPAQERLDFHFEHSDYFRVLAHLEVAKQICLQKIMNHHSHNEKGE